MKESERKKKREKRKKNQNYIKKYLLRARGGGWGTRQEENVIGESASPIPCVGHFFARYYYPTLFVTPPFVLSCPVLPCQVNKPRGCTVLPGGRVVKEMSERKGDE